MGLSQLLLGGDMTERRIDGLAKQSAKELVDKAYHLRSLLSKEQVRVDDDTARTVTSDVYLAFAECYEALSLLERIKAARDKQSTSKTGKPYKRSRSKPKERHSNETEDMHQV
jgi:hypothetical protein